MIRLALIAAICVVTASFAAGASACTCLPPPPADEMLENSDLVVAGRVVDVFDHTEEFYLAVALQTHAVWKSPGSLVFPTYLLITASDGAACGYHFEPGEDYLVYARSDGNGGFSTDLCGRNSTLAMAGEDLAVLGPPLVVPVHKSSLGMVKARFGQQ